MTAPSHDYRTRLARARDEAAREGVGALLVTPSADLLYLIGYDAPLLERPTMLVVLADSDPVLLVPRLEQPRAEASSAGGLLDMAAWADGEDPFEAAGRLLGTGGSAGVSDRMFAAHLLGLQSALPEVKFVPASPVMARLRIRKEPGEIDLLRHAARSADASLELVLEEGLEGRTEADVARALADRLVETGHDSAAFGIVGSGPNGASPHHEASDRVIGAGEAVVMDYGGRFGGYCSDITRTVAVGEPEQEVREVHEIVLRAQQAAFEAVRPGVPAQEIDRAARRVIADAGYGDAFIHRTGHGIGLDEHEHPYIVEGNEEPLEPAMCFSIEPGIYLAGRFGVRIEDIVTVTSDGAERLNEAPRELRIVG